MKDALDPQRAIDDAREQENAWGQHPECPVEVLADGAQVWRVPPGTEVAWLQEKRVILQDRRRSLAMPPPTDPELLWVTSDTDQFETYWRYLRRLDYQPRNPPGNPVE